MIHNSLPLVVAGFVLCAPLALAQQVGDSNRDYSVNAVGLGQASPVTQTVRIPAQSLSNSYVTSDPNAPVLWATSSAVSVGAIVSPANSIDLSLAGLSFLLDGSQPGPFQPFLRTDSRGIWSLSVQVPSALLGSNLALACAHFSPTSPEGYYVSQAHDVSVAAGADPTCNPAATNLGLGDDDSAVVNLGFNMTLFGTTQTMVEVWSNGSISFDTSGGGGFNFDGASFAAAGFPEIAPFAADLDPSSGGTVSFFTDNAGTAEVCWTNVPEYAGLVPYSFKATITPSLITLAFGDFSVDPFEALVGVSAGDDITYPGSPTDLSAGTLLATPDTVYEEFGAFLGAPFDLSFSTINFLLDGTGGVISVF